MSSQLDCIFHCLAVRILTLPKMKNCRLTAMEWINNTHSTRYLNRQILCMRRIVVEPIDRILYMYRQFFISRPLQDAACHIGAGPKSSKFGSSDSSIKWGADFILFISDIHVPPGFCKCKSSSTAQTVLENSSLGHRSPHIFLCPKRYVNGSYS